MSSPFEHVLIAATATACAEIITLPICTVKTNLQNHTNQSISVPKLVRDIYQKNGIRSFYQASFPAIAGQMISTSSKWALYKHLEEKNYFKNDNINITRVLNGFVSGVLTSFATHPIDLIKVHWQMRTQIPSWKLVYRGYSKSFAKVSIASCCFFPLNDYFKSELNEINTSNTNANAIYASALSGFTSTIIIAPIEYLKTRHIYGQTLYQGINPKIYYKGLGLNLVRVVPHFVITMSLIDYLTSNKNRLQSK